VSSTDIILWGSLAGQEENPQTEVCPTLNPRAYWE
jgi:hypothetical protein